MLTRIYAPALLSLESRLIEIECDMTSGLPGFIVVGLGDKAVDEARERSPPARVEEGLAPRLEQDVDPLAEDLEGRHVIGAEGLVLAPVVAAPGGEIDAAVAEQIEAGPLFGDADRVMQRQHRNRGREADVLGPRREIGEHNLPNGVDHMCIVKNRRGGVGVEPVFFNENTLTYRPRQVGE